MQPAKRRLLILIDWFDPAYRAGGPIRSAVNFVKQMRKDYDIFVLTGDRDLNEIRPLKGITSNKWIDYIQGVKVFYASTQNLRLNHIKNHIGNVAPDFVYLNSMFSKKFTIYPLWLKRANRISSKIVLAPRGMLKSSALDFKSKKKKIFLSFLKWMRVPQLVTFHATDEQEKKDIINQFGNNVRIQTASNFPGAQDDFLPPSKKEKGFLKMLFIGRIHPIKGLDFLLHVLKQSDQNITLTIVGNPEDISYRNHCRKIISELPENIHVSFANEVPHHSISQMIREHHIFCLPTKGENFGHAIFEALAVGRPVIISDQTPWRNLSRYNAGWDLPLTEPQSFAAAIEQCAYMDQQEFNEWCIGAWQFCKAYLESSDIKQKYQQLFN